MASSRGRRGKRSFTLAEVIRKLDESDEEVCDDSDRSPPAGSRKRAPKLKHYS